MKAIVKLMALLLATWVSMGCVVDIAESDDGLDKMDEVIGFGESAIESQNAMSPNGLFPNGLFPNGLYPNGLQSAALSVSTMSLSSIMALKDPTEAGSYSRMLFKYMVSCALTSNQSITIWWIDLQGLIHTDKYVGSIGLAPEWANGPLSETKQRWVSACLAARTNYFGVTVELSMRGSHPSLSTTSWERHHFTHKEGAFWGNLFLATPQVYACYNEDEVEYSRLKQRVCATGYDDGDSIEYCGILQSMGPCDALCTPSGTANGHYVSCNGTAETSTVFLN